MTTGSYRVGYRRPPESGQFSKGQSGNPKGRPKKQAAPKNSSPGPGAPMLEEMCLKEFYRPIEIRENGRVERVPMIQAVLRAVGVAAAKGNFRAQMAIVELTRTTEEQKARSKQALFETFVEYKAHWEREFARCDRLGLPRPDVVPHPDDIAINARTGEVIYNGPLDDHEKTRWDGLFQAKADAEKRIRVLQKRIKKDGNAERSQKLISAAQGTIDLVETNFPTEDVRRKPDFNIHEWRKLQKECLEITKKWRQRAAETPGDAPVSPAVDPA